MIVELEYCEELDELVLPLSDELMAGAGLKLGDTVKWINNHDGTWTLRKKQMTNFTFTCTKENSNITMNVLDVDDVDDVFFEFTQFLKGCGYAYDIQKTTQCMDDMDIAPFVSTEYNFDAVDHFWNNNQKSEFFWDTERNK